jgi:preprotein translocase subunit SecY
MHSSILNLLGNRFKAMEVKTRIAFTLGLLGISWMMSLVFIPNTPGLDGAALSNFLAESAHKSDAGGLLGMYSKFTGGGLEGHADWSLRIIFCICAFVILALLFAIVARGMNQKPGGSHQLNDSKTAQ